MTAVCPNGHQSATTDYCDQCGAKIEGRPAAGGPQPAQALAAEPEPAATPTGEPCPVCGAARVGTDRYCEGCGYDFTAVPAVGETTPANPANPDAVWEVVVTILNSLQPCRQAMMFNPASTYAVLPVIRRA